MSGTEKVAEHAGTNEIQSEKSRYNQLLRSASTAQRDNDVLLALRLYDEALGVRLRSSCFDNTDDSSGKLAKLRKAVARVREQCQELGLHNKGAAYDQAKPEDMQFRKNIVTNSYHVPWGTVQGAEQSAQSSGDEQHSEHSDIDEEEDSAGPGEDAEHEVADDAEDSKQMRRRQREQRQSMLMRVQRCKEERHKGSFEDFSVPASVFEKLYPYQKECVLWLWHLYCEGMGGILGDDMGLGKTVQMSAFLAGLFETFFRTVEMEERKRSQSSDNKSAPNADHRCMRVLILCPVSVMESWSRELSKWCVGIRVKTFHGSERQRNKELQKVVQKGGILLTTYDTMKGNVSVLQGHPPGPRRSRSKGTVTEADESPETVAATSDAAACPPPKLKWDCIILDEGHRIKNPDIQLSIAVRQLQARLRIILSGTPIQNKLQEMWSLFDFVTEGRLLGDRKTFKEEYANKIVLGNDKHATERQKVLGAKTAEFLRKLIRPYFLRRDKKDVRSSAERAEDERLAALELKDGDGASQSSASEKYVGVQGMEGIQKNDLILWSFLSETQLTLYQAFLSSEEVKEALNSTRSPLAALTVLKKICDHPRLLSEEMKTCKSLNLPSDFTFNADSLRMESGKLDLLARLLQNHIENGHRTLIFSQSKKMLNLIEIVLGDLRISHLRIDGDVVGAQQRQSLIDKFQTDSSIPVFLLTTTAGGLGITLTGADRVVIFDPAWNPAVDNQAVDRSFRLGQKKNVVVYRMITCGTIEEVIYRKQVFKGSLLKISTQAGNNMQHSYFARAELRKVFTLENPRFSQTQTDLSALHSAQRKSYPELDEHVQFLTSLKIFGISDHDLLFTKNAEQVSLSKEVSEEVMSEVVKSHKRLVMSTPATAKRSRRLGTLEALSTDQLDDDNSSEAQLDSVRSTLLFEDSASSPQQDDNDSFYDQTSHDTEVATEVADVDKENVGHLENVQESDNDTEAVKSPMINEQSRTSRTSAEVTVILPQPSIPRTARGVVRIPQVDGQDAECSVLHDVASLSRDDEKEYEEFVEMANKLVGKGKRSKALLYYFAALRICDADPALQQTCLALCASENIMC